MYKRVPAKRTYILVQMNQMLINRLNSAVNKTTGGSEATPCDYGSNITAGLGPD